MKTYNVCRLILLSFCLISFSSPVSAEEITLYAEDQYAPFSNNDGTGISNRIVIAAYKAVGVKVNLKVIPFARLTKWLEQGKGLGGFNAVPTTNTVDKFLFGEKPIFVVKTYLYFHKDRPIKINSIADLNKPDLNVGEVIGYMYGKAYLDLKFNHMKVKSDEQLINMLLLGRIDAAYITGKTVEHLLTKMNQPKDVLIRIEKLAVANVPLHIAFNRKHPQAQHYADLLDKGLKILHQSGRYQQLIK